MNIFENKTAIIGEIPTQQLCDAYEKLFSLAAEIRARLNEYGYLLDKYLRHLLEAVNSTLVMDAAAYGFETATVFNRLCTDCVFNGSSPINHPLSEKVISYAKSHPLSYLEEPTNVYMIHASLVNDFTEKEVESYYRKLCDGNESSLDICDFHDLYHRICCLLGSEELMEKLNHLFEQRFQIVTPMAAFIQSLTNQLIYCLTHHDMQTSKQIFQLMLDDRGK